MQAERLAAEGATLRGPPDGLCETPLDLAQDVMGLQALVIVVFLVRIQHRSAQDAMRRQLSGITEELGRLRQALAQDANDIGGRGS